MVPVHLFSEAAVIKNLVYIVSGDEHETSSERLLPTDWQELPQMHHVSFGFETAVVADRIYVCGKDGSTSVERFDPDVGVWELLQPMFGGHLHVCGGLNGGREVVSSVEHFDTTRNTWERLTPMTHARQAHVVVIAGRLFICGGGEADDGFVDTAEWFDPVTGLWEVLPDMRQERILPHLVTMSC